jgi:hypothetical protein
VKPGGYSSTHEHHPAGNTVAHQLAAD